MNNKSTKIEYQKVRIALVGCGRISRNHILSIAINDDKAQLVAVCDKQEDQAHQAIKIYSQALKDNNKENFEPKIYFDYKDLMTESLNGKQQIDLVVLATPSGLHPSQTISAARAGINVCTEKPMATRWSDGLEMVKACEKAKVKLFVVKQNRFNSTLQLVKRQIKTGRFGKIAMVCINVFWQRPQSYYNQAEWRGTLEMDGGALMNQASHYVDLLDWLIGPVESLSASTATLGRDIEAEDTAAIQLKWKNGALGTMAVTMLTYPKNLEGSITILGETGTVKIGGNAVNNIEHWSFANECSDDDLIEKASYETSSVYGFGHPPYYANMIECLSGKGEPYCDGREGLKSLELLESAYLSAKSKKVINLPLDSL